MTITCSRWTTLSVALIIASLIVVGMVASIVCAATGNTRASVVVVLVALGLAGLSAAVGVPVAASCKPVRSDDLRYALRLAVCRMPALNNVS